MYLAELALDFAVNHLAPGGSFLVKIFQGVGFEDYLKLMRSHFCQSGCAQTESLARPQQRTVSGGAWQA